MKLPLPSSFRLYNTLTRQEEDFQPLDPARKRVLFYSCGPTVYDFAHIGNFRSFLNADLLRRALELFGYEVKQVMNITDVGHMTDDADADGAGEDKMQAAGRRLLEAKKSGRLPPQAGDVDPNDPYAIAEFYTRAFLEDAALLGLKVVEDAKRDPTLMPRPTQYIARMIAMIEALIARGHAYVAADGVVYFDVQSFSAYGRLSGNTLEHLRTGAGGRVEEKNQAVKKHPADFMLWKPDPRHLMQWDSPWGAGYPGWHIECSAMARELLGEEIDLHSGGEDNIFPHHECEIAQSCGASGHDQFARCWFHTRFLIVEGEKMSKSKGNFFTLRDLLARGASPAAVRLALIQTHYRSNANFTMQGLADAQKQVERWHRLRARRIEEALWGLTPMQEALSRFQRSLATDLNVAGAVAVLNEAVGMYQLDPLDHPLIKWRREESKAFDTMLETLGVRDLEWKAGSCDEDRVSFETIVETKLAERLAARQAKDWARADAIRDELLTLGIAIKDGPGGTTWERIVR